MRKNSPLCIDVENVRKKARWTKVCGMLSVAMCYTCTDSTNRGLCTVQL